MNKTVVVTGSQGFIGGYLCKELLDADYRVVGIDNFSKYGRVSRAHDDHENFQLIRWDLSKSWPYQAIEDLEAKPSYIIAGAAMIGGISYFHEYAYDLMATNERIAANTFDAALSYQQRLKNNFERIVVISSSMVFEGADEYDGMLMDDTPWPTQEYMTKLMPPPYSTYGFQKLAMEYFTKGAWEQYKLPYTIVRPFNCVGIGEEESKQDHEVYSGNIKLRLSHVLPDLINKVLKGQDPLRILGDGGQVRCYTHGSDIARGIRLAMESDRALNEDFNISTSRATTVEELARLVWREIKGDEPLTIQHDEPFEHDVQKRIPDVSKAKGVLGFEAQVSLEDSVKEVVRHMREQC